MEEQKVLMNLKPTLKEEDVCDAAESAASQTGPVSPTPQSEQKSEVPIAKICPAYLRSNATSHQFPFSAIAELIDNANDPDVKAKHVKIEYRHKNGYKCLFITDNGNGMDRKTLFNMLSFGYSEKPTDAGYKAIGRYGNGFKSGSMRLGNDAVVLTKEKATNTISVGFLSQTLMEAMKSDQLLVPMVTWHRQNDGEHLNPEDQRSLDLIVKHSLFRDEKDLIQDLISVPDFGSDVSGTAIIIYNMGSKDKDGNFIGEQELDFHKGNADIIWRSAPEDAPEIRKSLRKYLQYLYRQPRMKISLLGRAIHWRKGFNHLKFPQVTYYTPRQANEISILLGFNNKKLDPSNQSYGALFYHNNRLIKAFMKLGYQKHSNEKGHGVIAVLEVDELLDPIHNKQDFEKNDAYNKLCVAVADRINGFWDDSQGKGRSVAVFPEEEEIINWVQCDRCDKQRRLPVNYEVDQDVDWFCEMHPNVLTCEVPQDKVEEGIEREILDQTAVRQRRERNRQRKRERYDRELIQNTEKRVKIEATKHSEELLEFMHNTDRIMKQMRMNAAKNFEQLSDPHLSVLEEVHRECVKDHPFPFKKCNECDRMRSVNLDDDMAENDTEKSKNWICSDGGYRCNEDAPTQDETGCHTAYFDTSAPSTPARTIGNRARYLTPRPRKEMWEAEVESPCSSSSSTTSSQVARRDSQSDVMELEDEIFPALKRTQEAVQKDLNKTMGLMDVVQKSLARLGTVKKEPVDLEEVQAENLRLKAQLDESNARMSQCQCGSTQAGSSVKVKSESEKELEKQVVRLVHKMIPCFKMDSHVNVVDMVKHLMTADLRFTLARDTHSPDTYNE